MGAFNTFRSQLLSALSTATAGLGDHVVRGVRGLPALDEPGAVATWLYALSGGDGTGGLVLDARIESARAATPARRAAWRQAYELMLGLREVLRELPAEEPAKASCEACEALGGCSACDGSGVVFAEARAA